MDDQQLLEALTPLFAQVFPQSTLELTAATQAQDVDGWDSLNHAILIDQIEQHFQIKFDLMDMLNMQNVGAICQRIREKKQWTT